MANEVGVDYQSSKTVYFQVRNPTSGFIWTTSGAGLFETYSSLSGNLNTYAITMAEQGASAHYRGNFPAAIGAGVYDVVARDRVNAWFAESDPTIAVGEVNWVGSGGPVRAIADLATSGQMSTFHPNRVTKGHAISGFMFKMVSTSDHVTPVTSGVISGQISRNGGSFTTLESGTATAGYTEVGLGLYKVNLTSGDLNVDVAALHFSAAGADSRDLVLLTQKG